MQFPNVHISCRVTSFLPVKSTGVEKGAGVESDQPLKLPGGHIPCMGSSFMYVPNAGFEGDYSLNLPDSHIHCMGTSFLHVWLTGVE